MKEKNREGGRTQHRKHNRRDQQSENETGARTEEDWTVWTFVVRDIVKRLGRDQGVWSGDYVESEVLKLEMFVAPSVG